MKYLRGQKVVLQIFLSLFLLLPTLLWAGQGMGPGPGALSYGSSTISISLSANQTSGPAPFAVSLDASGTTDSATTSDPFKDLRFNWDCGNTGAGTWSYGINPGVNSKNLRPNGGAVTACVYETPGSYTITLTVCNNLACSGSAVTTQPITVADPDVTFSGTNTACIGNILPVAGVGGCPTGANVSASSDFDASVASFKGTGKRILFKKGDTFTANVASTITSAGPQQFGAYGTGAAPIIQGTHTGITFTIGFNTGATKAVVSGLAFDGTSITDTERACVGGVGGTKILILRNDCQNINRGYAWNGAEWVVQDNTFSNGVGTNNIALYTPATSEAYIDRPWIVIQGNSLDTGCASSASETTRFPNAHKLVLYNNDILCAGPSFDAIKLHAPDFGTSGGKYSEVDTIIENLVTGGSSSTVATIGPQNGGVDERVRNVLVARNYFRGTSSTVSDFIVNAVDIKVVTNLFAGAELDSAMQIKTRGVEPVPSNVQVIGNSFYSPKSTFSFGCLDFINGTGHTAYNNYCWGPNLASTMFKGTTGLTQSNNSTDTQARQATSPFVGSMSSPPTLSQFQAGAASYGVGTGLNTVKVWTDVVNTTYNNPPDKGAYIH